MKMPSPATMRKALVAAVAFVAQLVQMNVLPPEVVPYATAVVAALTVAGVYVVPNRKDVSA